MKGIEINSRIISGDSPCFIIAEAGVNHNGDIKRAKQMIDVAKRIGADAIKFQTYKTEKLVTEYAKQAKYQKNNTQEKNQFDMLKKLELSGEEFSELFNYAEERGIIFLSTPFDIESADLLNRIGVGAFKIGSGDLTNFPLLEYIAVFGKPLILSTGMSTLEEISETLDILSDYGPKDIILLHCTSSYPTEIYDANLRIIPMLKNKFGFYVGFSDHTKSRMIPAVAVALGAVIVEKHFTLNHNLVGPDHKMSLEPDEFQEMVINIRQVEKALGNGIKSIRNNEKEVRNIARKSIVASIDIPNGTIISRDMLDVKRPGTGLAPKYLQTIIGKKARRNISKDQLIKMLDLE